MSMTTIEREAVAAVCLLAAFADGTQSDQEREQLRVALSDLGDVRDEVFQKVMMRRTTLGEEAGKITEPAGKRLAYDLAVGICNADGATSEQERTFLAGLAKALAIDPAEAASAVKHADEFAKIDLDEGAGVGVGAGVGAAAAAGAAIAAAPGASNPQIGTQIDDSINKYAAITAALELLPQSLASWAIVPLQTKMVYGIGKKYGYTLDRGHITEFLATVGMGVTGQVVESHLRRFLGTLAGKVLGKTAQRLTEKAAGPALTFGTTYALGQAAKSYYSGGRKLSMGDLRGVFSKRVEEAKGLYAKHEPSIKAQASKLNPANILQMVRGA